jgi:hypothetical protein
MTTSYWKFLERSQHFLQCILRKPAWDFNRFVGDPRRPERTRESLLSHEPAPGTSQSGPDPRGCPGKGAL